MTTRFARRSPQARPTRPTSRRCRATPAARGGRNSPTPVLRIFASPGARPFFAASVGALLCETPNAPVAAPVVLLVSLETFPRRSGAGFLFLLLAIPAGDAAL